MTDRPPPKGRGAALLEALQRRKAEEAKQVGVQQQAPSSAEEPPKPKGRAAYLKQLQEARLKRVGIEPSNNVTASTRDPTADVTKLKPEPVQIAIEKEVEDVSKSISELTFSEKEATTYQGKLF